MSLCVYSLGRVCGECGMATEETLGGFKADQVGPAIINLLHLDHNPDITRTYSWSIKVPGDISPTDQLNDRHACWQ